MADTDVAATAVQLTQDLLRHQAATAALITANRLQSAALDLLG
jgi:hypothetical protein